MGRLSICFLFTRKFLNLVFLVGLILVSTFGNSGVFFCFVVPERASGIIMQSSSVKVSTFDLMSAIIKGSMD